MQLGISLLLNMGWVAFMLLPTMILVYYGIVKPEEAYLHKTFKQTYQDYTQTTRRWL